MVRKYKNAHFICKRFKLLNHSFYMRAAAHRTAFVPPPITPNCADISERLFSGGLVYNISLSFFI